MKKYIFIIVVLISSIAIAMEEDISEVNKREFADENRKNKFTGKRKVCNEESFDAEDIV